MAEQKCIDLRAMFGKLYRCEFEESYYAEKPEYRAEESKWLMIIPCKWGHIYAHGGTLLGAHTESTRRRRELEALDCIDVHQDCEREVTVLFDVAHFDRVAAILQPKRRRRLSPEQRQASIDRLKAYRFETGRPHVSAILGTQDALERAKPTQTPFRPSDVENHESSKG